MLLTEILSSTDKHYAFHMQLRAYQYSLDHKFAPEFDISGTTYHCEADLKMVPDLRQILYEVRV